MFFEELSFLWGLHEAGCFRAGQCGLEGVAVQSPSVPSAPGDARSRPWARAKTRVSPRAALRSPLSSSSPYTSSLGMLPHATLSGELPAPGVYMGIHLSPQVSSAVLYGRSPVVSHRGRGWVCCLSLGHALSPGQHLGLELGDVAVGRAPFQSWLGCEAAGGFSMLREAFTGSTGV